MNYLIISCRRCIVSNFSNCLFCEREIEKGVNPCIRRVFSKGRFLPFRVTSSEFSVTFGTSSVCLSSYPFIYVYIHSYTVLGNLWKPRLLRERYRQRHREEWGRVRPSHRPNKRNSVGKMATCTSRKIVLERPSMLIPRYSSNDVRLLPMGLVCLFNSWIGDQFWSFYAFPFSILFFILFVFILFFWVVGSDLKAITLCPKVSVYWTNRALCHRKRKYVRSLTLFIFSLYLFLLLFLANFFVSFSFSIELCLLIWFWSGFHWVLRLFL